MTAGADSICVTLLYSNHPNKEWKEPLRRVKENKVGTLHLREWVTRDVPIHFPLVKRLILLTYFSVINC